ncbi:MAG TPA: hypothetical protein VKT19_07520 [Steroidobacteraceae bacterium]|nr:hypothetical protein [Steroidobacteraceae bacterium]
MDDDELERSLRRALQPSDPGEAFSARVMAHLAVHRQSSTAGAASASRSLHGQAVRRWAVRWTAPAAWAACALIAVGSIGLWHFRQHGLAQQRGLQARAQLLQALSIAGAQVQSARAVVLREEGGLE